MFRFAVSAAASLLLASAPTGGTPRSYEDSVQVMDMSGVLFSRDWHGCDAVALVTIDGNYDYYIEDGKLIVSLGLTGTSQHVQVNVDSNKPSCW